MTVNQTMTPSDDRLAPVITDPIRPRDSRCGKRVPPASAVRGLLKVSRRTDRGQQIQRSLGPETGSSSSATVIVWCLTVYKKKPT